MAKRALLYARVSTRNQEDNTSLKNQIDTTRNYAVEHGYQVVGEAKEVISGAFVLARTEFNRLLQMIADGTADLLIVDVPDRLGRGEAIANCELLIKMNGGAIEYTNRQYDLNTEEGIVMEGADKMISGLERLKTRRRTMRGKKATAESGQVVASPYRPYGYVFDRVYDKKLRRNTYCNLLIVEEEARNVRQIFEWCAYEGLTTHAIAKRLSKARILTVTDKDGGGRRKKNGPGIWHKDTVDGMLTNSTYKGEWRYKKNKIRRKDGIGGTRTTQTEYEATEQIPVPVPAIVSVELWELAQKRLADNKRRNIRNTKHKYLLRGRIRCSCGSSMTGQTQFRNGVQYYRCVNKYAMGKIARSSCNCRNLNAAKLETGLWELVFKLMTDEDLLFAKIRDQQEKAQEALKILQQNIAVLEAQNKKDEMAIRRFLDIYGDGDLSKEEYLQKRGEKESNIHKRLKEIESYRKHLNDASPLSPDREKELRRLREKLSVHMEAATFEQKRSLFDLLQLECTYFDDTGRVIVTGVFGTRTLEIDVSNGRGDESGEGGKQAEKPSGVIGQDACAYCQ